jgi:hypothetical protein
MSFGGDSSPPPAPYYPPVPPKEELLDVIDEVTGTQAITVVGADGKKKRVVSRLPRSEAEQKLYDEAGELMNKAIVEIKRLSDYDPAAVVDFAPFVDVMNSLNSERQADIAELSKLPDFNQYVQDFKAMGNTIIQDEFKKAENENKAYLANRGYADSSAAIGMRNSLVAEKAKALQQQDVSGNLYGEQLKAADLANRMNAYGFREQGRFGQLQSAEAEHKLKLDQYNQANTMRQQALQNQYGLFSTGAKLQGDDASKAMATRAPELANTIFQQSNMDSLNRHNAQVNQINSQYQNQLASYNSQRPSFGDTMLQLGGMGVGAYFGGPMGAMMGGQAGKTAGNFFR